MARDEGRPQIAAALVAAGVGRTVTIDPTERMPIYEFECERCGERFEELVAAAADLAPCPACGSSRTRRLLSAVAPPSRQPRGARVRDSESRRSEREAARRERLADAKKRRSGS